MQFRKLDQILLSKQVEVHGSNVIIWIIHISVKNHYLLMYLLVVVFLNKINYYNILDEGGSHKYQIVPNIILMV